MSNQDFTEIFHRISHGKFFDIEMNIYTKSVLNQCLNHFLSKEEFEKCVIIRDIINKRYDHNNNYK